MAFNTLDLFKAAKLFQNKYSLEIFPFLGSKMLLFAALGNHGLLASRDLENQHVETTFSHVSRLQTSHVHALLYVCWGWGLERGVPGPARAFICPTVVKGSDVIYLWDQMEP